MFLQISHKNEGPYGNSCYITSHNQTDSIPQEYWWTWKIPQKKHRPKKPAEKSWHDVVITSLSKRIMTSRNYYNLYTFTAQGNKWITELIPQNIKKFF